jgi:carnosine N-methyltransferase
MIVQDHAGMFEHIVLPSGCETMKPEKIAPNNVKKIRDTLKSAVREWSKYGEPEREQAYTPILEEIASFCKETGKQAFDFSTGKRVSVLNPGCGMGRLVYELARRGYKA